MTECYYLTDGMGISFLFILLLVGPHKLPVVLLVLLVVP